MAKHVDRDLIAFLREQMDPSVVAVTFDPGPPGDTDAGGDVFFADYDGDLDYPLVAIVSNDPVVPGGGETGFTGIDSGGGGPVQDVVETILVDCWGGPVDDAIYDGAGTHPDDVANNLGREVWSVCNEAAAENAPAGYEWIGASPPSTADDEETHERTHYRDQVVVRLKHTQAP